MTTRLSIGQTASLACILEATAPKPGNVHRAADFTDCTINDFLASAVAIASPMAHASSDRVGETIVQSVQATRSVTKANTNLGIVLLLTPLAAAAAEHPKDLRAGVRTTLDALTPNDSQQVYQAIRLAKPGGMDGNAEIQVPENMDVNASAPVDLVLAMQAAESYDMIARQYTNGFSEVFEAAVPKLCTAATEESAVELSLPRRIVHAHVELMSEYPDSLIQRKCGSAIANESATRAAAVIGSGPVGSEPYLDALSDLDFWLRSDGNRRNPGTTADLIAAGLFVGLWEGRITPPFG